MAVATDIATVQIGLVSTDRALTTLLREILAELKDPPCTLTTVAELDGSEVNEGIWLWDYQPGKSLPFNLGSASRYLFLVDRQNLAEFRDVTAKADVNILLKPITRSILRTLVGMAVSAYWERNTAATSLREDRDELLQCLIRTSLRLQDYDYERTAFLSRAVHDFRAPLTAVSGYCGLLLGEHLGELNKTQKEVLERMHRSTRRLSRMTSAMFNLSVGRHVRRCPRLAQNDIQDCLEQALHEITTYAEEKRIAISTDLAPCDFPLFFEAGQIEQVLINILDNACKFTPKAGSIQISGYPYFWERRGPGAGAPGVNRRQAESTKPNGYRIDIRDSGGPIPAEHLQRIFEEYASYDENGDRSGGGLGLAITHMIMAQHDGRVWAENTPFGPQFSLVLPRRQVIGSKCV